MSVIVSPSILTADFGHLADELQSMSACDWVHIDVMDGVFVPNISIGFPIIKAVKDNTDKVLDVHLMIVDPDRYIDRCKEFGADIVTFHFEACRHLHRTVSAIKAAGMKAGVSLNPHVPVSLLEEILPYIDLVLIMSVNPGYGGQAFIESSVKKVRKLKKMIDDGGYNVTIEIDGGVNERTGRLLVEAGADALVAGNYVVSASDRTAAIKSLQNLK
ncbi:MAG: ribulose-phosphate 3-epimerase [Bacteroidaceae bacterium]|nr:ribulose-phosphate 3-epimerase [Bacteroidaceae bacterium]